MKLHESASPRRKRGWLVGITLISLIVLVICALTVLPAVSPGVGAQVADTIRSWVGPKVVAEIESVSFGIQDKLNQLLYTFGKAPNIQLDKQYTNRDLTEKLPTLQVAQPSENVQVTPGPTPLPITDAVSALPDIGWKAYGPTVNGEPVMARAIVAEDPTRPYSKMALVRMDLQRLTLHVEPGISEPSDSAIVKTLLPHHGAIPTEDVPTLIAAFNGGFKGVNGHYGMMIDGVTLLPPTPGIATIILYADGHVAIEPWDTDMESEPDIVAFRQNCPPILVNGELNPLVNTDDDSVWGDTIGNLVISWRTGLGITEDGRYLIYAMSNATTVGSLAKALHNAGAYNAMQLDINEFWTSFVIFTPVHNRLTAIPLIQQMEGNQQFYPVASKRDFFYVTSK